MQNYAEFINQSVDFPQAGFQVRDDELYFHDINLMELLETYGTPLRFSYLPIISENIQRAKKLFHDAIRKHKYSGRYTYCYCTKSSHFSYVLEEALKNDIHLETSSAFDIPLIEALEKKGQIAKDVLIICNGFKSEAYKQHIVDLIHDGFTNIIPVLDNKEEFFFYDDELDEPQKIGIRVAVEEQPDYHLYTSRLGIRADDVLSLYSDKISQYPNFQVTLLHFFTQAGIHDTPYYWNELEKVVNLYCKFRKINPHLDTLNIGGGLPYRNSLFFEYDYEYMIGEIVSRIKAICASYEVPEPNLITEFGSFTVAESQGILFRVIGRKMQNDREKWLMINGSLMTSLPDIWALGQKYILLPVNNWDAGYERVVLGGITCDSQDYYSEDAHVNVVFLPKTRKVQYLGFFHTGAYQESLSGFGGIHHCLIPTPRHVLIRKNTDGGYAFEIFNEEQTSKQVLKILGYS
ncbi:MAG: arginine decarboxylase [Bacteroidetes bacterium]|jgi:arginine decarboxylase|nr:arginine decarboxylase [Bacteroidota bacterium]